MPQHEGLTETEVAIVRAFFEPRPSQTGETEAGAAYVVAMDQDKDGFKTTTVCRERGQYAILDPEGWPLAEAASLYGVLELTQVVGISIADGAKRRPIATT